jgi:peptidoglycan/xylan/chitin deacetylase (PgdA/CDA1 family)
MQNGYIVLQHDGENRKLSGSVQALPDIIDDLKTQGYTFVTIPELLDTQPYQ